MIKEWQRFKTILGKSIKENELNQIMAWLKSLGNIQKMFKSFKTQSFQVVLLVSVRLSTRLGIWSSLKGMYNQKSTYDYSSPSYTHLRRSGKLHSLFQAGCRYTEVRWSAVASLDLWKCLCMSVCVEKVMLHSLKYRWYILFKCMFANITLGRTTEV